MNEDIVLLLFRIKANIGKIENGERAQLRDIESDFLELMELMKLLLISERDSYYGYFMMNMTFKVDFTCSSIAGIQLETVPPVFVSNPLLLCKFTLKEILFIICHEIEHIILNHPAEMVKCNPNKDPGIYERFNYAADASVNDRLKYEIKQYKEKLIKFPEGCIDSPTFAEVFNLSNVRANESYQYYYSFIKDKANDDSFGNQLMKMLGHAMDEEESDEDGQGNGKSKVEPNESGEGQVSSKSDTDQESEEIEDGPGADGQEKQNNDPNDGIVTSKNVGQISSNDWGDSDDAESVEEITREFLNETVSMMSSESRGLMPAGFMSQIELLNRPPEIPWEKMLKKYIGSITAGRKKTRTRLNRRQPERYDLSGTKEDKVLKIAVAIDTSGSVGDAEIARIFDEIFAIIGKRKAEVSIIECDAQIQRVYRVKQRHEVQTSVRGRGGTRFTPVIEHVNNDKYYRDALLIYFTDGFGEWEVPKPLTYRNIWVVLNNEKNLSVKEPYGIVLKM